MNAVAVTESVERSGRIGRLVRENWIRDLGNSISKSESVVVVQISKVNTRDLNKLRQALTPLQGSFHVVRNGLCRVAFEKRGWKELESFLSGTCAIAPVSAEGDVAGTCKLLIQFAKDHEGFVLQGGLVTGQVVKSADIKSIAQLPSRTVLLAQLAGVAQAPMRNLAVVLVAPIRNLALLFKAVAEKKEKEAPKA